MRTRPPQTTAHARRGFTLVEVLMVALVLSVLAATAAPNLRRALVKARAADLAADLDVVHVAVISYQAETHTWPPDRNRGIIPPGLDDYLPEGFTFAPEGVILDYDNWSANAERLVGVTVITPDRELGLALLDLLGGNAWTNGTDKFTWIIQWRADGAEVPLARLAPRPAT